MAREFDRPQITLEDERRDLVRTRILKSARHVISALGSQARVEDVAVHAGVGRRTVFRYFPTRDELLAAAFLDGIRSYLEHVPARGDRPLDDWLEEFVLAVHRLNAHYGPGYFDLILRYDADGVLGDAIRRRRQSRLELTQGAALEAWRAAGGRGQPPAVISAAFSLYLGSFATAALGDTGLSVEEAAALSTKTLLALLAQATAD